MIQNSYRYSLLRWISVPSLCLSFALPSFAVAKTIRFGMNPWIANYPLNIADQLGYFKQEGLDVQVINFSTDQEMRDAILTKRVDLSMDMLGSFIGYSQDGYPITILAQTDWSFGGDKIILKKNLAPKNLKGKTIGVYQNRPSVTYFLDHWLKLQGLNLKDIKLVELNAEDIARNFVANRFSAMVNYDPNIADSLKRGNGVIKATTANYPGIMPEGIGGHSATIKSLSSSEIRSIFKAWKKALVWAKNPKNNQQFLEIVLKNTFKGEISLSQKEFRDHLSKVKVHDPETLIKLNNPGQGTDQYINAIHLFLKRNGLLKRKFDSKNLFHSVRSSEYLK